MSRFGNLEFEASDDFQARTLPSPLKNEDAFYEQAEEAFAGGRFEEALRKYAKVLEFNPARAQAWTGQVRSLIELREFDEARVWADKALATFPDENELLAAKGVALARAGDIQGALSFSDAAVESRINTPYIWLARGDVLLALKEKRAEFCFEKALTISGRSSFILWFASRIQFFYQRFATALKLAQEGLSMEPGRASIWLQLGECQLALGLATQARNSFEQARELDPLLVQQDHVVRASEAGFLEAMKGRMRRWFPK